MVYKIFGINIFISEHGRPTWIGKARPEVKEEEDEGTTVSGGLATVALPGGGQQALRRQGEPARSVPNLPVF